MDDYQMFKIMRTATNDMEHVRPDLPPFAMFADEGMNEDDVAKVIATLSDKLGHPIALTFLPECLMDIVDLALHRPRTLDRIRQQAKAQTATMNLRPFVPLKEGLWTKVKRSLRRMRWW